MAKNNINTNFENLKAEMMKKKEVANEIKNNDADENVNIDKNVNISVNEMEDIEGYKNTSISENKIIIKKAQKVQPPKRITYYLNQETIKKIEKYSKLTGLGKSELVQTLLDVSLNNLEVE